MSNAVNGATWVSFHHGGGVGMGYSLHSGVVIVDGTDEASARVERVLTSDPALVSCAMPMPVTTKPSPSPTSEK